MRVHSAFILFFCLLMLVLGPATAQVRIPLDLPLRLISDDSSVRLEALDSWFLAPLSELRNRSPRYVRFSGGGAAKLSIQQEGTEYKISLVRARADAYEDWNQGSWHLYRDAADGRVLRLEFYPRSDKECRFIFSAAEEETRSRLDILVYDAWLRRALYLPWSFNQLLTLPLRDILGVLDQEFLSMYFEIPPNNYRDTRALVQAVREKLPLLRYADDGALNHEGLPVYIASPGTAQLEPWGLNCSGFAKWIVDGVLRGSVHAMDTWLPIDLLKNPAEERGSSFSKIYEQERNPWFGLDWVRNLASEATVRLRGIASASRSEYEVTDVPFAVLRKPDGSLQHYPVFMQDSGFAVEGLAALLYHLAVSESGYFYLASVNHPMGTSPTLRQHFHVAVFFPNFDSSGQFNPLVFESAAETSLQKFIQRYPGHLIYLVRVPVERTFNP